MFIDIEVGCLNGQRLKPKRFVDIAFEPANVDMTFEPANIQRGFAEKANEFIGI